MLADSATSARGWACPQTPTVILFDDVVMASESVGSLGLKMICPETVGIRSLQLILNTVNKCGNEMFEAQASSIKKDSQTFFMRLFLNVYILLLLVPHKQPCDSGYLLNSYISKFEN